MTQKPSSRAPGNLYNPAADTRHAHVAEVRLDLSSLLQAAKTPAQTARSNSTQRLPASGRNKALRYADRCRNTGGRKATSRDGRTRTKDAAGTEADTAVPLTQRGADQSPPLLSSRAQLVAKRSQESSPSKRVNVPEDAERRTSLYHLSVLDRNRLWLARKQQKLEKEREAKEFTSLDGCTFTPVIYTRIPHKLQSKPAEDLLRITHLEEPEIEVQNMSLTHAENLAASPERRTHHVTLSLCEPKELSPYRVQLRHFNPDALLAKAASRHK